MSELTELDLGDEPSEASKEQAQRVVATHAIDTVECRMFLEMLGIGDVPQQPPGECLECGEPLPITARTRRVGYAGHCSAHRKAALS